MSELLERLAAGPVICGEGYLFELERRGYLQAGGFVPEVVLEHPEEVSTLHREFVHAGSDVVEAFTYYAHREKLRVIGQVELLEPMNRQALRLAERVARETGALLAGNVCNTTMFDPADPGAGEAVRAIFDEQIGWALEAGVDFVVGETFSYLDEASLALAAIRAAGLPSVITLAVHQEPRTRDGYSLVEACRRLVDEGADVVGLNCARGPATMLPLLGELVAAVSVPVAALPVPSRATSVRAFPTALDPFTCNRYEIAEFTEAAAALGVRYLGLCCGAAPHHLRAMAEALGRRPGASRYSEDMSRHVYFGTSAELRRHNLEYGRRFSRPAS
jgi:betaine-homocysteine S-methyltransferase